MTHADFNALLESRITKLRAVLTSKAGEYAKEEDRLHNFKSDVGGMIPCETPPMVAWGYLRKHLQSVYDMVFLYDARGLRPSVERIDEKIGDAINYLVLLEALFREGR